ncbi:MAG: alkaline phosphatase family protein [Chitinophagales bacterium]|nr:alkaline phosphatase family protein [Chitinophagales bacterium]
MEERNMYRAINKMMHIVILACFVMNMYAQKVICGPFLGDLQSTSVRVWVATKGSDSILVQLFNGKEFLHPTASEKLWQKSRCASKYYFDHLQPSTHYQVFVNGVLTAVLNGQQGFTTAGNTSAVNDFNFLAASCALVMHRPFGVVFPGASRKIFDHMAAENADCMLWMGDNVYLLPFHLRKEKRVFRKNLDVRTKMKPYKHLINSQVNYSIWDDHDFGPNNGDSRFPGKLTTDKIFNAMWPNPTPPESEHGRYYSFVHEDIEIFMLDNRSNKINQDSSNIYLGKEQLEWLQQSLKASKASFKIIVNGGQIIARFRGTECMRYYKDEFNSLFDFIRTEHINGVVCLSGDIHHTELLKDTTLCDYPIYELTSSPMTSMPSKGNPQHPQLVPGTLVDGTRSYAIISVTGIGSNRKLVLEAKSKKGEVFWQREITLEEVSSTTQ